MNLNIPQLILLAWFALAAVLNVLAVGKDRQPTTPAQAVTSLVLLGVMSWLVVIA